MGELLVILMNFWNGLGAFEKLAAGGGLVFASTFFIVIHCRTLIINVTINR